MQALSRYGLLPYIRRHNELTCSRHDVIRTLLPYHCSGMLLPWSFSGYDRDGSRFFISVCKLS
ncbi:hypothetical protein [Xenorhabdus sp. KK7.4]|uniref:hypothetical protein n=1 Tax=Xenorhabdus sp. KK7.4 TaxID=1851572 RepID=UPI00128FE373|nr:hypothetical protein [Xenorhabdus sp. KK7.4]